MTSKKTELPGWATARYAVGSVGMPGNGEVPWAGGWSAGDEQLLTIAPGVWLAWLAGERPLGAVGAPDEAPALLPAGALALLAGLGWCEPRRPDEGPMVRVGRGGLLPAGAQALAAQVRRWGGGAERVAVYGSLRRGLHNHEVLAGAERLGVGVLPGLALWDTGLGYPVAVEDAGAAGVACEVYAVPPGVLERVRRLEAGYREVWRPQASGAQARVYVQGADRVRGLERVTSAEPSGVVCWRRYLQQRGQL